MNVQRSSIGAWLFGLMDVPEWADKKLRYWPLILAVAGATLLLGPGLNVPAKLKSEPPFIEWEKPKPGDTTQPVNERAVAVGLGLILLGVAFSIQVIPVADREIDEHWPQDKVDAASTTPVLFIDSPLDANADQILRMLKRFGRTWPPVTIRWPKSSQRLLDEARELLKTWHKLDTSNKEMMSVVGWLPNRLTEVDVLRGRFSEAVPAMVQRCTGISDEKVLVVLRSYLVRANYRAHMNIYKALEVAKASRPDIEIPEVWKIFSNRERMSNAIYGVSHPLELRRGILVAIGDQAVYSKWGPGLDVNASKNYLSHRVGPEYASWTMLIPEVEAGVAERGGQLPSTYSGEMLFSEIGPTGTWRPGGDPDVSADENVIALKQRYEAEWQRRRTEDKTA